MSAARCVVCGRFTAYENLRLLSYTPDSDFTSEETLMCCVDCFKDGAP